MSKTKVILAIGMILLFIGLAFSPATAKPSSLTQLKELPAVDLLNKLSLEMSKATDYNELIATIQKFITDYGRHPFLVLLLQIIIGIMNISNKIDGIRPLRKNAFIMSWGFTNKINPFKNNNVDLYRPLTLWYYSGKSNLILNSRTVIISFSPFQIKMLTGRQIGFMRNFAGLYWHRETTLGSKSFTIFMGKSTAVRGFDLSFLNILGQ